MKILICGPTGSGKTTLATALAPLINAVVWDGDYVRDNFLPRLGFSHADRCIQATRMSLLCAPTVTAGGNVIAAFCCPTDQTRDNFNADFVVSMERKGDGKHPDTDAMWSPPLRPNVIVNDNSPVTYWANQIARRVQPVFDGRGPTALFVGRYQPFHFGHKRLIAEGIRKYGQACIGVRDSDSEWPFDWVKARIEQMMAEHHGRFTVIPLPNIAAVCYGRDVGYKIDHIFLDEDTHDISATKIRAEMAPRAAEAKRSNVDVT